MASIEPIPSAASLKARRRRRLLKALLWCVGLLVGAWTISFAVATHELNKAINALKARGEPTTFAEAARRNVEAAAPKSAAEVVQQALAEYRRIGMPGDSLFQLARTYGDPFKASDYAEIDAGLKAADGVVELLQLAVLRPPGPLTSPTAAEGGERWWIFPAAQEMRSFSRQLSVDVRYAAATGNPRRAFERLKLMFEVGELLSADAFVIPQLIRAAMHGVACETARGVLGDAAFTADELAELAVLLARIGGDLRLGPALVNQRALDATLLLSPVSLADELHSASANARPLADDKTRQAALSFVQARWIGLMASPLGLPARRWAAAESLSVPNDVLELVDAPTPWPEDHQKRWTTLGPKRDVGRLLLFETSGGPTPDGWLSYAHEATLRARRQLAMLEIACRLKRHLAIHRVLPERLDELREPKFPELPTTWFQGAPFVYARKGRAARVEVVDPIAYSVGGDAPARSKAIRGLLIEMDFAAPTSQRK